MPLKITVRQSSGVSIIDLEGRLVIGPDADALKQRLDELARQGSRHILVNLAKVTQLDSSGICSLLHGYTMMKQHSGSFKMLHPAGHAREVLEVMRLIEIIPTLDDEKQAVASFSGPNPAQS
jgi:anti-sigma B factor antagonist